MRRLLLLLCVLALVGFLTTGLQAQTYQGLVQGIVTDQSDAAVPAASVILVNVETGVERKETTDAGGRYLLRNVIPGNYLVRVEAPGFSPFIQENVVVRTAGDVTVNAKLTVGTVAETITVTAETPNVQFNTASMNTNVEGEMLRDVPVLARNPFTLALLNPAVINRYWDVSHRNPFYMWSSNGMDVGGQTGGKNNMLLDGAPLGVSARGSYAPPMDAVQEVVVQQNAVDAQQGYSAGGVFNIAMKTGTNDLHGTAYYFGRNPKLNAMTNRIIQSESVVKNHIWGGTAGGAIIKNKLFYFGTYEQWKSTQPRSQTRTMPTDLERTGDFSRTLTPQGDLRPIYDPWTTQFDPATGTASRQPFAGNVVPADRLDPTGLKVMKDLWGPNGPGDNPSGVNNFRKQYAWWLKYWNISGRVDYNITDKLRVYGRFSKYQTRLDNPNWGGTRAVPSDNGGLMDAINGAFDLFYLATPSTTINLRYSPTYVEDDYDSAWAQVDPSVWDEFWPSGWHKPLVSAYPVIYYPNFTGTGLGSFSTGKSGWWQVHARSHNYQINMTHQRGMHSMKFGHSMRYSWDENGNPAPGSFRFHSIDTANTFKSPDLTQSGSMYASLLLGSLNSSSQTIRPFFDTHQYQMALYFQDDIKLTRRITLNLGLRWEYEAAPYDDNDILSRQLDLTDPIPEFQQNPPVMPPEVADWGVQQSFNGAWQFVDSDHRRIYDAPKTNFLPRLGVAFRINDETALRAGYSRNAVPVLNAHPEGWNIPKDGFSQNSSVLGPLEGVPRAVISDPYNTDNPLRIPVGKGRGRYTNLGDSATWFNQDLRTPMNDRFNVSLQRQLPWGIASDVTFFVNLGHDITGPSMWGGDFGLPLNLMDPQLSYTYKGETDQAVDNPFFGLDPSWFPGTLRSQETVALKTLLKEYPQYGNLTERFMHGRSNQYYALQIKVQRSFSNGLGFLFGYNYNQEKRDEWFNDDTRYVNQLEAIDTRQPRHYVRLAGTYDFPFGRGRPLLNNLHPVLEAIVGGWRTSSIFMWNGGPRVSFHNRAMVANGDPTVSNPTLNRWFDTSVFQILPPYTPRTNPWYYDGLRGPGFWNLDTTLSKFFKITERVKFELRMEFYNMPNVFMPSQPNTNINSGTFGQSTGKAGGNYGREIQYTARIHF